MKPSKILHHYIGTGLKVEFNNKKCDLLGIKQYPQKKVLIREYYKTGSGILAIEIDDVKPIFNSLSSLTKEIVVEGYNEGKTFLSCQHLIQKEIDHWCSYWDAEFIQFTTLEVRKNSIVMIPQFITIENEEIFEKHITVNISNPTLKTFTKLIQWHFCPWENDLEEGSWIDKTTLTQAV